MGHVAACLWVGLLNEQYQYDLRDDGSEKSGSEQEKEDTENLRSDPWPGCHLVTIQPDFRFFRIQFSAKIFASLLQFMQI